MSYQTTVKLGYGSGSSRAAIQGNFPAPPIPTSRATTPSMLYGGMNAPVFDSGMLFRDVGNSGLRQYSGWVREEFLPQLVGRQAARVYREMQDNSSVVGAILFAINSSMRKVDWRTEPADDSPEGSYQAEFIDGCRDDMSHTWSDFITEQLSMLGFGYAPHEIVYKRSLGRQPGIDPATGDELPRSQFDDGLIRWRRIPLRGQETILKWFFGPNGEIKGVTQQPWIGAIVDIPIEKMMLFRPTSHKNNPEGRSILRTAYRSYYLANRMEELEAILFERMGGIPTVYIPKTIMDQAANGDSSAVMQLNAWKAIATNVRIDEQMGMVMPSDRWNDGQGEAQYRFELTVPTGGRGQMVDSDKAITRYSINMMSSVLADFIQLGHESRGTQSLSVSKTDMFFQAMEGFLNSNADVINRYGIPRLCDLNGMDPESNPTVHPDMPQRLDLDVLSNFVLRLSQAGMPLFPNEALQEYITDAAGMPDISEDANYQQLMDASLEQNTVPPPDPNAPPAVGAGGPQDKLKKMIAASIARRVLLLGGAATGTTKKTVRKRKRRSK